MEALSSRGAPVFFLRGSLSKWPPSSPLPDLPEAPPPRASLLFQFPHRPPPPSLCAAPDTHWRSFLSIDPEPGATFARMKGSHLIGATGARQLGLVCHPQRFLGGDHRRARSPHPSALTASPFVVAAVFSFGLGHPLALPFSCVTLAGAALRCLCTPRRARCGVRGRLPSTARRGRRRAARHQRDASPPFSHRTLSERVCQTHCRCSHLPGRPASPSLRLPSQPIHPLLPPPSPAFPSPLTSRSSPPLPSPPPLPH